MGGTSRLLAMKQVNMLNAAIYNTDANCGILKQLWKKIMCLQFRQHANMLTAELC